MSRAVSIIGAGPGGLAAAMLLARAGLDVTVHEARDTLGGRSGTLVGAGPAGAYRFDIGPTFFLYPQILREIFASCGQRLEDRVTLVRLDPQYRLVFEGGGAIAAAPDMARMAAEIARFSPRDAAALPGFMADNRRKLDLFRPVLQQPFHSARDLGARIVTGAPVQEILFEGRRAVGVRTAEGVTRADALVINSDFAHTMTTLVPPPLRRRWSDRRIGTRAFSCSTFMLYLGIEGPVPELGHHTIWLAEDYRRNLAEIEAGQAPATPSFYVQNASVTDPGLAPPGHSTLYVLLPVGNLMPGSPDWTRLAPAYREVALRQLARLGVGDLERRIRFERMLTPADWAAQLRIHRGATFNLAHSLGQMLHWRPRNRFEDLDGVYLVGGGTHPGSGLPVIFESARITSRLLADDLGVTPLDAAA